MNINSQIIDLRSDTVTLPSEEMLDALKSVKLGDDVFSEDPTVNKLQEKAANIMGKEGALLVPSGTMGNLVSILVHCNRGDEVILGDQAHTFLYEAGGISAFGGIHSRQLKNNDDGTIDLKEIQASIREENVHFPPTTLISLENTHNRCFGAVLNPDYMSKVSEIAKKNNCKVHLDGARIFNASVALDLDVKELTKDVDSLTFCLSKGLSSPIGSIICGTSDFIKQARHLRKALGGGMRQAGIIAKFGEFSLDYMTSQIKKDHKNALLLGEGLSNISGIDIDIEKIHSNIVYFKLDDNTSSYSSRIVQLMNDKGILFFEVSPNRYRLVTHYGIESHHIDKVINTIGEIL
ncbi:low-specificity L-threonine aldolase [Candidatus Marinimicrobia bacterium]|nr:low-specificity L-threonine aldolase [Candidatus Neomarinimicrobiota bacterium]